MGEEEDIRLSGAGSVWYGQGGRRKGSELLSEGVAARGRQSTDRAQQVLGIGKSQPRGEVGIG